MIDLTHTVEEVNIIIHALAKLPYEAVKDLIEKIHGQAKPQVDSIVTQQQSQAPQGEPVVVDVKQEEAVTH